MNPTFRLPALGGLHRIALLAVLLWAMTACSNTRNAMYDWLVSLESNAAGLESTSVPVEGLELVLLQRPPTADAPTLLMVHGFGASKESWLRMARELPPTYGLLIPDLAGHGSSSKPADGDYSLPEQARRLQSIIDQHIEGDVVVLGNSMGGAIAAHLATMRPDRIKGAILFAPAGIYEVASDISPLLENGRNPLIARDETEFDELVALAMTKPPFIPWPVTGVLRDRALADRPIREKIYQDLQRLPPGQIFEQVVQDIQQPVLVIWGKDDRIIAAGNASTWMDLLPNGQVIVLEDIGHVPMLEDAEHSATLTVNFLNDRVSAES